MTLKGLWTACFSGRHPRFASCESNGIPTRDTGAAGELAALDSASPGESGERWPSLLCVVITVCIYRLVVLQATLATCGNDS